MASRRVYVFGCPICRKTIAFDAPGEPCCTGPSETRDEHPLTLMHCIRIDERAIHPNVSASLARGPLILP